MTPKEKADELVSNYVDIMPPLATQTGSTISEHAKKCALICVNELISTYNNDIKGLSHMSHLFMMQKAFWQLVKKELI